jgi:hypothetical protein
MLEQPPSGIAGSSVASPGAVAFLRLPRAAFE